MAIPTPQELKAREDKRVQERRTEMESYLERVLENNTPTLKSTGGEISYRRTGDEEQNVIRAYLAQRGWGVTFTSKREFSYSMTTRSEVEYDDYYLNLTPLPT